MSVVDVPNSIFRILIVDDHPVIRYGLEKLFSQQSDFQICGQANDFRGAQEAFQRLFPDLVIVDISLDGRSGLELVRDLKAQSPRTRFLVVSLHDEKLFAEKALAAGADGYVNKREPLEQVLCAVRRVAEGHVYLSQEATEQVLLRRAGGPLQIESSGPALSSLSARELEIFGLIGRGYKVAEIAERLFISSKTVYSHIERLKQKLGFPTMTELVRDAVTWSNSRGA